MSVDEMSFIQISVDQMSVNEMLFKKMSVNDMSFNQMSVDEMSFIQMSADQMLFDEKLRNPGCKFKIQHFRQSFLDIDVSAGIRQIFDEKLKTRITTQSARALKSQH
jgi:hypothetical protein